MTLTLEPQTENLLRTEPEGRLVSGIAVPYGQPIVAPETGKTEYFVKGAFAGVDLVGMPLDYAHGQARHGKFPVGKITQAIERDEGLWIEAYVSTSTDGETAYTLLRDGTITHFSVNVDVAPGGQSNSGAITRVERLKEVSLTTGGFAVYRGATVQKIRDLGDQNMSETLTAEKVTEIVDGKIAALDLQPEPVDMTEWDSKLRDVTAQVQKLAAGAGLPEKEVDVPDVSRYITAVLRDSVFDDKGLLTELHEQFDTAINSNPEIRSFMRDFSTSGITATEGGSSDASGAVFESFYADKLVHLLNTYRPFASSLSMFPMPRSGSAVYPVVTQDTLAGERDGGQLTDVNSRKIIITQKRAEAIWYDAGARIALEAIKSSELSLEQIVKTNLMAQLAYVTEDGAIAQVEGAEAGNEATGSVAVAFQHADPFDWEATNPLKDFFRAVQTESFNIWDATAFYGTKLALPYADWIELVSLTDGLDHRQFGKGGDRTDGSVGINTQSVSLFGGLEVFASRVTDPILFNPNAVGYSSGGVDEVRATNVEKLAADVALLNRQIVAVQIPSGVVVFDGEDESV